MSQKLDQVLPPSKRSQAAQGLADAAASGEFKLQCCDACGLVQYPPRDACGHCLSTDLTWQPVSNAGQLLTESTLHVSTHAYFQQRLPWRIGTVKLDVGPSVICNLTDKVSAPAQVKLQLRLDEAGQGVMFALPA